MVFNFALILLSMVLIIREGIFRVDYLIPLELFPSRKKRVKFSRLLKIIL